MSIGDVSGYRGHLATGDSRLLDKSLGEEIVGIWEDYDFPNEDVSFDRENRTLYLKAPHLGLPEVLKRGLFFDVVTTPYLSGRLVFTGVTDFKLGDEEYFSMLHRFIQEGDSITTQGINWIKMYGEKIAVRYEEGIDSVGFVRQWKNRLGVFWTIHRFGPNKGVAL